MRKGEKLIIAGKRDSALVAFYQTSVKFSDRIIEIDSLLISDLTDKLATKQLENDNLTSQVNNQKDQVQIAKTEAGKLEKKLRVSKTTTKAVIGIGVTVIGYLLIK